MKTNLHHRHTLRRLLCAALMALSLVTTMVPAAAASDLDGGLSLGGTTANVTDSTTSMAAKLDAGIWWIGCYRDVYQALNLQYDKVSAGLVLDPMNFQSNEVWVLKPVSSSSAYFTLAPLSHPSYYIAGQNNDCQLRLSNTSASDPAVQWMAIADGNHYVLVNRKTGLAMDTAFGKSDTANPVLNFSRNGYCDAQSWNMIRLSESTTTLFSGTRVSPSNGTYALLSASNTGKCVNVQFASTAGNGTAKIVLDTWNQESNECFILTDRGSGQYTISPSNAPNVCLNCWAADPTDGNQLTLATWQNGDQCSLWEIYQSGSYYSFRNVKTGLWLNLWMNCTVDGTKLVGYHYDGTSAMKWKLQAVSSSPLSSSSPSSGSGLVGTNQGSVNYIKQSSSTCKATSAAMAVNLIMGRDAYSTQGMIAYGVMCKNLNGNTYTGSDGNTYRTTYKTDTYTGSLSEVTNAVETAVANGLPIVVAVHKNGGTKHHWILLVGKDSNGQYLVVDPGRGGSGSIADNVKTMSSLGYSFGLTDYSTTHYGYISFAKR